jgi:hypothetical protein
MKSDDGDHHIGYSSKSRKPASSMDNDEEYNSDYDLQDLNDSDGELDKNSIKFGRNSIGRVLRPGIIDDHLAPIIRQEGALQELWGDVNSYEDSTTKSYRDHIQTNSSSIMGTKLSNAVTKNALSLSENSVDIEMYTGHNDSFQREKVSQEHADRLAGMAHRTGMNFGAVPSEFDSSGIPKYGMELSDDELDDEIIAYSNMQRNDIHTEILPSKSAIAYDSDLDRDSDTDIEIIAAD